MAFIKWDLGVPFYTLSLSTPVSSVDKILFFFFSKLSLPHLDSAWNICLNEVKQA